MEFLNIKEVIQHLPIFPIFLQPDDINLLYFKLRLFGLIEYMVSNIQGCKDKEMRKIKNKFHS